MSSQKFTIYIKSSPEGGGYIARCIEVPLMSQASTKEEALKNLREAIESTGWKLKTTVSV
jgi:predicted RNase H-like HicB family nuclease